MRDEDIQEGQDVLVCFMRQEVLRQGVVRRRAYGIDPGSWWVDVHFGHGAATPGAMFPFMFRPEDIHPLVSEATAPPAQ